MRAYTFKCSGISGDRANGLSDMAQPVMNDHKTHYMVSNESTSNDYSQRGDIVGVDKTMNNYIVLYTNEARTPKRAGDQGKSAYDILQQYFRKRCILY